jgi:hypothetical protein
MRYTDLMAMKNDKVRGEIIRERLAKIIYKACVEECGEDFAKLIVNEVICPTGENSEQTFPKNSIVADVGDITDKDGFEKGALVNITIKVLNWNDVRTAKTDRTALTFDDILEGIEKANEKAKKTAEENAEKEKRKQAKIERDEAIRRVKKVFNKKI